MTFLRTVLLLLVTGFLSTLAPGTIAEQIDKREFLACDKYCEEVYKTDVEGTKLSVEVSCSADRTKTPKIDCTDHRKNIQCPASDGPGNSRVCTCNPNHEAYTYQVLVGADCR